MFIMERNRSAFTNKVRVIEDHVSVDATDYQIVPYVTGGLGRLVRLIKEDKVPQLQKFGHHTNEDGHFDPKGSCLMGLRYNVKTILDSKGQSAILVLAEDLFRKNQLVVIKVLHTKFYRLGSQESHFLWRLAISDPLNHSHTLRMLTTFSFDGHFCLVFEPLLPDPLTTIFQECPSHKVLPNIKKVGLRLLATIGFLHQQNLIHTDLKPDNILLKQENDLDSVHIVDFGNTIHYNHSDLSLYYQDFELQTPLYRAPEVMFGVPFGPEIDIWSLGCIFAELYLGKPLLLGDSTEEILKQMYELLGPFPAKLFRRGKFYQSLKQYTSNKDQADASTKIFEHLQFEDYMFADLLAGMLRYNPDERLTASQAAQHPFFASYFPVSFLVPSANGGKIPSTVPIPSKAYQYSPKVDPGIKKGQPSSIDLLRIGTSELHPLSDHEETLILKPSPRYKKRGENVSLLEEPTQLFPSHVGTSSSDNALPQKRSESSHSDISIVKNVIAERRDKFSDNVKEKMSSLLKAIRQEQNLVENDIEQQYENSRKLATSFPKGKNLKNIESVRPIPRYKAYRDTTYNQPNDENTFFKAPETVSRKITHSSDRFKQEENNSSKGSEETGIIRKNLEPCNTSQEKRKRDRLNQISSKSKEEMFVAKKNTKSYQSSQENVSRETLKCKDKKDIEPCQLSEEIVSREMFYQNDSRKINIRQTTCGNNLKTDDRTYILQDNVSGYNLDKPQAHSPDERDKQIKASPRSTGQDLVFDTENESYVEDVNISPGFTPARTPYRRKHSRQETTNRPHINTSYSSNSQGMVSTHSWTNSSGDNSTDRMANKIMTFDEVSIKEHARSMEKSQSQETKTVPYNSLKSEGRKRVYSDCLSDDEIIDVLSPVSTGFVRKRHKLTTTTPDKWSQQKVYKGVVQTISPAVEDIHNLDDKRSNVGGSRSPRKPYSIVNEMSIGLQNKNTKRKYSGVQAELTNLDVIENSIGNDREMGTRQGTDRKMFTSDNRGRMNSQECSEEDGRNRLHVNSPDTYKRFHNKTGQSHNRPVGQIKSKSVQDVFKEMRMDEGQIKSKNLHGVFEETRMPTPIQKFSHALGSIDDSNTDSPEIVYKKSFKHQDKKMKSMTNRHTENYNDHKAERKNNQQESDTLYTNSSRGDINSIKSKAIAQKDHQKSSSIKQNTPATVVQVENTNQDKFTFLGTPASALKNEGDLAERIAKRRQKLKKPARKSLNFRQSSDLLDENSDDLEDSDVDYIDETIDKNDILGSPIVRDYQAKGQKKKLVRQSNERVSQFYRQDCNRNFPDGMDEFESPVNVDNPVIVQKKRSIRKSGGSSSQFDSRESNLRNSTQVSNRMPGNGNSIDKHRNNIKGTSKCDTTFVLDFESPLRNVQGNL